jgi:deoxyhypusine synthase
MKRGIISQFILDEFRHFNAAALKEAALAYEKHLLEGGEMMITLAGAMSTAELGLSLAEMIRKNKVQAISCTGANLEEDVFNLVAHEEYLRIPHYRDLTPKDEEDLLKRQLARVTDTCIPEESAMRKIESHIIQLWKQADAAGKRFYPHEFLYDLLKSGGLKNSYQIDPKNSWLMAAAEKNLPLFVPGWEDSTLGNIFASHCLRGTIKNPNTVRNGIEYMMKLHDWYREKSSQSKMGFFQIGGGIAGDFPICVVPMIQHDLQIDVPVWSYFCQISDSTTSFGSYSGAIPNEKITWGKLNAESDKFIIESDATIVAPLIFALLLNR